MRETSFCWQCDKDFFWDLNICPDCWMFIWKKRKEESNLFVEKDEDKLEIRINEFHVSFYIEDWKDAYDRANKIIEQIQDFKDDHRKRGNTKYNPYKNAYIQCNDWELCIAILDNNTYWLQFTYESVDFFTEISLSDLYKMKEFLEKNIKYLQQ